MSLIGETKRGPQRPSRPAQTVSRFRVPLARPVRRPRPSGIADAQRCGMLEGVIIEVLVVPDCPHEQAAFDATQTALDALGLDATITTTVMATDEQATARGFIGSPTILIDGKDPFAEPGAPVGLACRVYQTAEGLAGTPAPTELRAALREAAQ